MFFMQKCISLAKKGFPYSSPNPMVGAVLVHHNKIIGEGYHKKYGLNHAEVEAINSVKNKQLLAESTLYVNLEPCAHFGKTPPCSDLIIKHKIFKVVIGCKDTYAKVSGKGIKKMKNAGIKVITGILEKECRKLNQRFFTYHEKKRPYIILKWAESKDGFIAPLHQNKPFWMTSNESKILVHKWRSEEDAILIGRITAEKDNPSLTVRKVKGRNPIRVVIDRKLALSSNLELFNNKSKTIIFNELKYDRKKMNTYIKIDFKNLITNILHQLHEQNIQSIIIEGGFQTLESFIKSNTWDEARIFTANKKLKEGIIAPRIEGRILSESQIDIDSLKVISNE